MDTTSSLTSNQLDEAELRLNELLNSILTYREKLQPHFSIRTGPYTEGTASLLGELEKQELNRKKIESILEVEYRLPDHLINEARWYSEPRDIIERACRITVNFQIELMSTPSLDPKLVCAIFADLNVLGYMFDRATENYPRCKDDLIRLISALNAFKRKLTTENRNLWNASTAGGCADGQCLIFLCHILQATGEPPPRPLVI